MSEIHNYDHSEDHADHGQDQRLLTIRAYSGLSGDMFLAGLIKMTDCSDTELQERLAKILPDLIGTVHLVRKEVNTINGWHVEINLPHQHEHRTLKDILAIIEASHLNDVVKDISSKTFTLLARAEGNVHGKKPEDIHFHEIGALDSILDICLSCDLFTNLSPEKFIVSPLPLADGNIHCAHGIIPAPAPAVLELLENVVVCPFTGYGETITPTAIALLKTLNACYGLWPSMKIIKQALVYGDKTFLDAPNGALFALGMR